jgi:hypothetical protein
MICLSLETELATIGLSIQNEDCLRELGEVYAKCIEQNSKLSSILLALFYQKEARLYSMENSIKELKAIVADLDKDYPPLYKAELKLILSKAQRENGFEAESQVTLKEVSCYSEQDLDRLQLLYLQDNLIGDKSTLLLRGKEQILFSLLILGPSEKFDLILKIYGENCDISKAERSFKTLLNRLRKKVDQEIILNTKNMYELI